MNVPATFEVRSLLVLPVPELIGGGGLTTSQKNWFGPWLCPHSLSPPPKKNPMPTVQTQTIYLCTLVFPRFYIAVLSGGCEPPILGKGGRRGSGMAPFERALVSSYSNFSSIFTRFRDIAAFVL